MAGCILHACGGKKGGGRGGLTERPLSWLAPDIKDRAKRGHGTSQRNQNYWQIDDRGAEADADRSQEERN